MRKIQYLTLTAALALLAGFSLAARTASARCLDAGDDCRPPAATHTLAPAWTPTPTAPAATPTPTPVIVLAMSTDMPAAAEGSGVSVPPLGCQTPPPWYDVDQAVRCAPYWPPPFSTPLPNCPANLRLICWGYLYFDPGWFLATPTLPPPPTSPPPAYP